MNTLLEQKVIEMFVIKDKRERYKQFVMSDKNRHKFIDALPHFKDWKWDLFDEVGDFHSKLVNERIASLNLKRSICYVMSEDNDIDKQIVSIEDLSGISVSDRSSILVFGEANLIYYQGEPPFNRYISRLI